VLREAAGLGAWKIISAGVGSASARLEVAERLAHVQHTRYQEPTAVLVQEVGGDEEIPQVRFSIQSTVSNR
jgi:hypothetical protein